MSRSTAPASSRSKTWKGVAAGVAAIALLAGGGASFAEWRDSASASAGAPISSGVLDIESNDDGAWTDGAGNSVQLDDYLIVPGTTLIYTHSMTIDAEGDGLAAEVSTNIPALSGDSELIEALTRSATMTLTIDGQELQVAPGPEGPTAEIPTNVGEQTLDIRVELPFAADGTYAQGGSVDVQDLTVTVAQPRVEQPPVAG
ncbi:alternate-type signal peptide domain-containing protein [Georgenia sp. Z1491]|uniref:alternate-type signal peptide domain-containing protein n=1 Tax=Georgenia sp. Z1491 TaxID=3416707 RepID=UPI003CE75270